MEQLEGDFFGRVLADVNDWFCVSHFEFLRDWSLIAPSI